MKRKVLPQNQVGYVAKGIYALPIEKRKDAFNELISKGKSIVPTEYRLNELKKMRGDI